MNEQTISRAAINRDPDYNETQNYVCSNHLLQRHQYVLWKEGHILNDVNKGTENDRKTCFHHRELLRFPMEGLHSSVMISKTSNRKRFHVLELGLYHVEESFPEFDR